MIHQLYLQNFYYIISPPNKKELVDSCINEKLSTDQSFLWKKSCSVETKRIEKERISTLIVPSLQLFLKNFDIKSSCMDIQITDIWMNTYKKGDFQEIHDHSDGSDFSAVLFLDDHESDFSNFYFYNRNSVEITNSWRKILYPKGYNITINPKKGDFLFFPSHILHGVTPHKSHKKRRTISFNFKFLDITCI